MEVNRRGFLAGTVGLASLGVVTACSGDDGSGSGSGADGTPEAQPPTDLASALDAPGTPGLMDEDRYQQRIDEYLAFATASLEPGNATGVAAHLVRATREPDFTWDIDSVTVDAFAESWAKIDAWEDTRDFNFMYLHWLLALGEGDTPSTKLDPALLEAIETRLVDNRFRYNDPNPEGRVDELWYWSENHIIIGRVIEYLAGQRMPDRTFTISGLTGTEQMERSRPEILEWIDERARFGFFEWHSNVYMLKNITPLITLIELADDPELVRAAAMALDLCLVDLAGHTHAGTYTASRGRTYKKDKTSSLDEATFSTAKFLFDDTTFDYQNPNDGGATYLCAAARYRPPQVTLDMATAKQPGVLRERHGIFVDGADPVVDNPKAPYGYDFDDPKNLSFWWSQGAVGMWQVADIGLSEAEKYGLFEVEQLGQVKALVDLNDGDIDKIRPWLQKNHAVVNFGHLREANSYAWRGDAVSLASVVDHRFGQMRDQAHSWQAAIDANALVFTNHPVTDVDDSTDWGDDGRPGYWTGEASMPRSAQHERTAVHIYQPAWDESTDELLWGVFGYQPYTHAYVPQDRFDEVTQDDRWTFARKGDGWIALWSWREPTWRTYDPAKQATDGMSKPFDLVAEGGPDNVWLVEVGEAADGDFADWKAAVLEGEPTVERSDDGFSVTWTSPSAGEVTFGSTAPFTVDGKDVALGDYPRHDSAFGTAEHLDTTLELSGDTASLALDFEAGTRTVAGS
ncbi:MAG: hypothetical protein R2754_02680 [Microthrixaceae bacterium]